MVVGHQQEYTTKVRHHMSPHRAASIGGHPAGCTVGCSCAVVFPH